MIAFSETCFDLSIAVSSLSHVAKALCPGMDTRPIFSATNPGPDKKIIIYNLVLFDARLYLSGVPCRFDWRTPVA